MPAPATPSTVRLVVLLSLVAAGCGDNADRPSPTAATLRPLRDTACVAGGVPSATDAGDDGGYARQLPPDTTIECVLVAGGPPRRIRIEADTARDLVTAIVLLDAAGRALQRLPAEQDEPPSRWAPYLVGTDFDADGGRDLALRRWAGATGNVGHEVWRFDPPTGRFAHDSTLSATPGLRPVAGQPCVEGSMKGGMAGMVYGRERLCRVGARWVRERDETQDYDDALRAFVRVTRERRGDTLATVRVDTVRAP